MILCCKLKGHYLPLCAPPLLALQTLPFKNFSRATFTMYYIKKAAAKFTLNGSLLMLNVHFCYIKIFYQFIAFITILSLEKITRPQDYFEILSVQKLKKVEKHCYRPMFRYFFEFGAQFEKILN